MKKLSVILAVLIILTLGLVGCGGFGTGKYTCYKVVVGGTTYTEVNQAVEKTGYIGSSYVEVRDDDATVKFGSSFTGTWTFENNVFKFSYTSVSGVGSIEFKYDEATGDLFSDIGSATVYYKIIN